MKPEQLKRGINKMNTYDNENEYGFDIEVNEYEEQELERQLAIIERNMTNFQNQDDIVFLTEIGNR